MTAQALFCPKAKGIKLPIGGESESMLVETLLLFGWRVLSSELISELALWLYKRQRRRWNHKSPIRRNESPSPVSVSDILVGHREAA